MLLAWHSGGTAYNALGLLISAIANGILYSLAGALIATVLRVTGFWKPR
jgi:hypothetical protein